jgi:tRNA G18 (ribose-2'-O)-methylase SpoU
MVIESKDNKHFKEFKKLTSVDGVRKYRRVIVSGRKLIKEITQSVAHSSVALIIYERYADDDVETNTIIKSCSDAGLLFTLKKHLYNELDTFNTGAPLLVFQTPEIPEWDFSLAEGCNLLIPFQDPLNVGAVIRSAAGFGVKKIIMLKEAAHPFHPRSIKASAGAVLKYSNLPSSGGADSFPSSPGGRRLRGGGTNQIGLFKGPSINDLKPICDKHQLEIIALDLAGAPINSFKFPNKFLLLPGMEGTGVPEELNKTSLSIPITDLIESLNAAIAVSIAIYYWKSSLL